MAAIPLNTFKTKTSILGTSSTTRVYTAPTGVTSIILMANASNISSSTQLVSLSHYRNFTVLADAQGNGYQAGQTTTEQVKDFAIPASVSGSMMTGKMVLESGDSLIAFANTTGTVKLTLSVLETANA